MAAVRTAVACASGSAKGVFVHGVLQALRDRALPVDAYGAASSSSLPAAYAAADLLDLLDGTAYWEMAAESMRETGDVSLAIKRNVEALAPALSEGLFMPRARRFVLAVSRVTTPEAAAACQGDGAKRVGLEQLRAARSRDRSWAAVNLALSLYDTRPGLGTVPLAAANLPDALYATTRMLHAWRSPAWIDGAACVDASYTCSCPALELAELGYEQVIAVLPEPGPAWHDLYQDREIPPCHGRARIAFIRPAVDLTTVGVDYLSAGPGSLRRAFELGQESGMTFDPAAAFGD